MDTISDTVIRMVVQDVLEETKKCHMGKGCNEQKNEKEHAA